MFLIHEQCQIRNLTTLMGTMHGSEELDDECLSTYHHHYEGETVNETRGLWATALA